MLLVSMVAATWIAHAVWVAVGGRGAVAEAKIAAADAIAAKALGLGQQEDHCARKARRATAAAMAAAVVSVTTAAAVVALASKII